MNGKGSVTLNAGIEKAWEVLLDPEALKIALWAVKN